MVKGGGIGGSKHREINLDGFPLTKSPVIDFAISREILIVLPMYFLKRETWGNPTNNNVFLFIKYA